MFYEERLIEGRMCFRTTPDGEWREYGYGELSRRYADLLAWSKEQNNG